MGQTLAEAYPWLVDLAMDFDPCVITTGSNKVITLRRESCGHGPWKGRPYSLKQSGGKVPCRACKDAPAPGESFAEAWPSLAQYWHPDNTYRADELSCFSNRLVVFLKPCGHGESTTVRVGHIAGSIPCRECPQKMRRSFADAFPHLVESWSPENSLSPAQVACSSPRSVRLSRSCKHGGSWDGPPYRLKDSEGAIPCRQCAVTVSRGEQELADFIRSLGLDIAQSDRSVIAPLEIDIHVLGRQIGIEFNGLRWHSEEFRGRDSHAQKHAAASAAGVQLITVWEDDWRDRRQVVEKMLCHKLGLAVEPKVHARKCYVVPLKGRREQTRALLLENHIQGPGGTLQGVGLERLGRLVAVMTFTKTGPDFYLDRYATSAPVPGGFTKLLHRWRLQHPAARIITFSDNQISDGGLYSSTGFVVESHLAPDYSYIYQGTRQHKFNFRLKRFREDPALEWRPGLSERQLAELNGIPRLYDSGKVRWVMPASPR